LSFGSSLMWFSQSILNLFFRSDSGNRFAGANYAVRFYVNCRYISFRKRAKIMGFNGAAGAGTGLLSFIR